MIKQKNIINVWANIMVSGIKKKNYFFRRNSHGSPVCHILSLYVTMCDRMRFSDKW